MRVRGLLLAVSVGAVTVGGGFVLATPALATAPEAPETLKPNEPVAATTAILNGVVNPKIAVPVEAGEYEFLYKATKTATKAECESAGASTAPVPAGGYLGATAEPFPQEVTGLTQGTEYVVCLAATNTTNAPHTRTVGNPVPFTTEITPEIPDDVKGEATSEGVKLKGILNPANPGNPGTYEFLYAQSESGCSGGEATSGPATGAKTETVEATVTGLLPNTAYTFCLRARNEAGEESALSAPLTLTTLVVAPAVSPESESFTNVGSSSATLHATLSPGGTDTSFFFEYGLTTAYGSSTPVESAGAGALPVAVAASLDALTPGTPYHFRVVVSNEKAPGGVAGPDDSFSTFPASPLGLPDGRGYELVSPLDTGGHEEVLPLYGEHSPIHAAPDGSALAYLGRPTAEGGNGHSGSPDPGAANETNYNEYLARRSAGGGWTAANIQPLGLSEAIYTGFSGDLSTGILVSPQPLTAGVPGGGYNVLYARAADGSYRPLFTKTPSHHPASQFGAGYVGTSADGSHILFEATDALLEGDGSQAQALETDVEHGLETESKIDEEANKQEEEERYELAFATRTVASDSTPRVLYDDAAGGLNVVNVLPDGELAPTAVFGSEVEFSRGEALNDYGNGEDLSDVISASGSRIFWTATEAVVAQRGEDGAIAGVKQPRALYVRENDTQPQSPLGPNGECAVSADACTVQVDASALLGTQQEKEEKGGHGTFWAASADGSRVFFTDELRLTGDATAEPGKPDLYEYQVNSEAGRAGILTDLTVDGTEPANVAGVLGASEDGSYVYFAAAGALAPGAQPQACAPYRTGQPGEGGKCNVYVIHDGEAPKLVGAVATGDGEGGTGGGASPVFYETERVESLGDWAAGAGVRSSRVTPDGRHLLFESVENITGFDSHGAHEIYLYDFGAGVTCVSCNPSGATELGGNRYARNVVLPESLNGTYATRDLSNDGDQVFFDTTEALVPQDQNGLTDVYEWERHGSGSCAHENGCLYLLSGGTSSDFSMFLDASESGEDAFIATRAELVPEDHGEGFEIYDARVGAPQQPTPQVCTGTGCQGVPSAPPVPATPSSITFEGAGNFPPPSVVVKPKPKTVKCAKGKRLSHGKCVKPKRKKATPKVKRAKKASGHRGAK